MIKRLDRHFQGRYYPINEVNTFSHEKQNGPPCHKGNGPRPGVN